MIIFLCSVSGLPASATDMFIDLLTTSIGPGSDEGGDDLQTNNLDAQGR